MLYVYYCASSQLRFQFQNTFWIMCFILAKLFCPSWATGCPHGISRVLLRRTYLRDCRFLIVDNNISAGIASGNVERKKSSPLRTTSIVPFSHWLRVYGTLCLTLAMYRVLCFYLRALAFFETSKNILLHKSKLRLFFKVFILLLRSICT